MKNNYTAGSIWIQVTDSGKFAVIELDPVEDLTKEETNELFSMWGDIMPHDLSDEQRKNLEITIHETPAEAMQYIKNRLESLSHIYSSVEYKINDLNEEEG